MQRALGLRDDEVVDEATVAAERLGAHAGGAGEHVVGRRARGCSGRRRAPARAGRRRGAARSGRCATSGGPCGRCRAQARVSRRSAGGRGRARRLSRAPASSAVGPISTSSSVPRVKWTPRNGSVGVGHRVDERAHEVAALGPQAQPGAAERDDARVGVAAGRDRQPVRPRAGAEDREARAALAAGCGGRRAGSARRSALSTAQPVTTSPPAASTSSANARATAWKSTTAVAGECSASTPSDVRLELGDLLAGAGAAAPARRWRGRGARARRAAGPRPRSSATISFPSWRAGIPRSWQYASSSGAPSVHRRAFSEPGA